MEPLELNKRTSQVKFQEIVDAFNIYWSDKDSNVKGSGYKPFKRWQTYWENFVDSNGYLPSSNEVWDSYKQYENEFSTRSTLLDESDWQSLGPTTFVNRNTSVANIGRVNVIIQDPSNSNIYYAGAPAGGIWKSDNSGVSWVPLSDNLPQIGVSGIAVDYANPQLIYIATGDDDASDTYSAGVFKSEDGGSTWMPTGVISPPGSFSSLSMNDIYIHPTNSNILWVATNNGVYKTINGGDSWSQTLSGNIKDIKLKPGDPNTVYAVKNDLVASPNTYSYRFYKSIDGGDNFNLSNIGLPSSNSGRMAIDVTPANPNVVYILSATKSYGYQGVYKSINSGFSFTQTANTSNIFESTQAWYDMSFAVSDTDENSIFVGVLNIWRSNNGGDSFSKLNNWSVHNAAYTHADIHFLRFYNGDLFTGTDGGFFKSTDNGTTFSDLTTGMEITQFYRISVSQQNSNRIAGGTQDNGGFGYDNQWSNYHGGDGMEGVVDPNNDNHYYGFMQFGTYLFFSSTAGQSGTQSFLGAELDTQNSGTGNWITPLAINSDSEVYSGYNRLYKFNGSGWDAISPTFNTNIDVLEIDPSNPDNIYVAINNSLRKSTDRGLSFSTQSSFINNITSIEVNNNDSNIIYVTTAGFDGGVFKSIDGGITFSDISDGLNFVTKNMIKHRPNDPINTIYLATHIGVFKYDDNTSTWDDFNNNLPNTSVRDLAINEIDNKIIAGTYGRGIWVSDMGSIQLASDDVRIISISNPINNNIKCGDFSPNILVKNNGLNVITSIDFTYKLNDGTDSFFTWNGNLASLESTSISLPSLSLDKGEYNLDVEATITNDTFSSNNKGQSTFYINTPGIAGDVNDFESIEEELITYNTEGGSAVWQRGIPTGTALNTSSSPQNVYGTNLSGNHPDNTKSFLYTDCYNLTEIGNPILKFKMAFEIEQDWDLAYVEFSTNEGITWSLLGSEGPDWYNSSRFAGDGVANDCYNCVGGQWTGFNTTLTDYEFDLNDFLGESNIIFRFVFHSDQLVNYEGVVIDDLFVDGTTLGNQTFNTNNFNIYPNPSKNVFNIKFSEPTGFNLNVTNLTGQVIISEEEIKPNQNSYKLNMSNYTSGIYFLNIETNGKTIIKKLILN